MLDSVGRDLGEDIDQNAVIGNWSLMVGVRPVGAPDAAIAKFRHQFSGERHGIGVRRASTRHAIRRR